MDLIESSCEAGNAIFATKTQLNKNRMTNGVDFQGEQFGKISQNKMSCYLSFFLNLEFNGVGY